MKQLKRLNGWGIFQNNQKEIAEYGFSITVLHPDNMAYAELCTPADTDMEMNTLNEAIEWIKNY